MYIQKAGEVKKGPAIFSTGYQNDFNSHFSPQSRDKESFLRGYLKKPVNFKKRGAKIFSPLSRIIF